MELLNKFQEVNTDGFPEFDNYDKPLEMGLWILWVAKEKLNIRMLTARQISDVIVSIMEVSINQRAIINSFNPASGKVHRHFKSGETYYEIMRAGKDHLMGRVGKGTLDVYYFEPGKRYSSKKILTENILSELKGSLKIVDPYCDSGTLDILSKRKTEKIKFLTSIEKLQNIKKQRFLRDLKDFKSEYPNSVFKNYDKSEIHDRYIISSDRVVILGYSLKDLGSKESFAIVLNKETSIDTFGALEDNFNRRWKVSTLL